MGKGFKKLMAMAAVSAMTLTTLVGCGSEDAGSAGGGDTLKWGVNYEQSGTAATYGLSLIHISLLFMKIRRVMKMETMSETVSTCQIKIKSGLITLLVNSTKADKL